MRVATQHLRIASRASRLALWQAEFVKQQLLQHFPELDIHILPMTTQGDQMLDAPLAKVGGKGLFVKELEAHLLSGDADIAVHSMKDVPVAFPEGLHLPCILERHSPHDAWVSTDHQSLMALPAGAVVGTSSLRRQCQLQAIRQDLKVKVLRGNVGTRLDKLKSGDYDAIILAEAGLQRLQLDALISQQLSVDQFLPAVGQGALGVECRVGDTRTESYLAALHHAPSADRVFCERAMNAALNGGCQVPIAGYAVLEEDDIWLRGLVGDPLTGQLLQAQRRGPCANAQQIGQSVAKDLLAQGGGDILTRVYAEFGGQKGDVDA